MLKRPTVAIYIFVYKVLLTKFFEEKRVYFHLNIFIDDLFTPFEFIDVILK